MVINLIDKDRVLDSIVEIRSNLRRLQFLGARVFCLESMLRRSVDYLAIETALSISTMT